MLQYLTDWIYTFITHWRSYEKTSPTRTNSDKNYGKENVSLHCFCCFFYFPSFVLEIFKQFVIKIQAIGVFIVFHLFEYRIPHYSKCEHFRKFLRKYVPSRVEFKTWCSTLFIARWTLTRKMIFRIPIYICFHLINYLYLQVKSFISMTQDVSNNNSDSWVSIHFSNTEFENSLMKLNFFWQHQTQEHNIVYQLKLFWK